MRYQLFFTTMYSCTQTNKQHRTELVQIVRLLESPATCSYAQQDKTWVEHASWLLFIPLWLVAYYIFLRTFHLTLSSSLPFSQQQVVAPHKHQPGVIESELSRTTGASSNEPLAETQQQCRHQLVHRDTAIAATKIMAQNVHLIYLRKTGLRNRRKQHTSGWELLHIGVERGQLAIQCTAGACTELRNQIIATHTAKCPWSMNAFVCIVREFEHHDVVRSGIFADEYTNKGPWEWTKQVLKIFGEAMES